MYALVKIDFYLLPMFIDNGCIEFPEFIHLMKKMHKPSDDRKSALDAFRAFDETERGNIDSKAIRDIMIKTLDLIPRCEVDDLLSSLGLSHDRTISYEGKITAHFFQFKDELIFSSLNLFLMKFTIF